MKIHSIELINEQLRIIDQTQLPGKLIYRDLYDYKQIIYAIKRLEVRGAPAIGIAAAYGIAMAVRQSGKHSLDQVRKFGEEFKASRPTAVNLFWAVDRVVRLIEMEKPNTYESALSMLWLEAKAIHDEDRAMCQKIGEYGASLIPEKATILTHCNTGVLATAGIGTALGVIYTCRDQKKNINVYVDETRPVLQGARLTMWELQQEDIPAILICDNTAGMLMAQKKISCVIVGADRIARNGDTANKIGTYSLAVLAQYHKIPFYVAAPATTFDLSVPDGSFIVIEERAPEEVTEPFGLRIAPKDSMVYAPAFDVTPRELISTYITDTGIQPGGRG